MQVLVIVWILQSNKLTFKIREVINKNDSEIDGDDFVSHRIIKKKIIFSLFTLIFNHGPSLQWVNFRI